MNENKRFNAVDVIIIITIIMIIGVSVFRAFLSHNSKEQTGKIDATYTVTVPEIDIRYANSANIGDDVYYAAKALKCGTISNISTEYVNITETLTDENGNVSAIKRINPSKIKMNITIDVSGQFSDSLLYIGKNTYISEGQKIEFYTDTFTFSGIVTGFTSNK